MNDKFNGSFKPKRNKFSQVSNYALRDNDLTLKAKGLYSLIQSYITIENFILYKATLQKQCKESNTAFESAWKELKDKGYLIQEKTQSKKGVFFYQYELLDEPIHTPKTQGVDNPLCGEPTLYNKTDKTNTELNNTDLKNNYIPDGYEYTFLGRLFKELYIETFGKQPRRTIKTTIDNPVLQTDDEQYLRLFILEFFEEVEQDKCTLEYFDSIAGRFM